MSTGKFKILFLYLPFFLLIFSEGCMPENEYLPPTKNEAFSFTPLHARLFFNTRNEIPAFPFADSSSVSAKSSLSYFLFTPCWDKVYSSRIADIITHEIPLKTARELSATFTRSGAVNVVSTLVIQKHTVRDSIRQFISTVIGYETRSDGSCSYKRFQPGEPDSCFTYTGKKQRFCGLMILSEVSGKYLRAYYYLNGKSYRVHLENENARDKGLFGLGIYMQEPETKWSGGYEGYHYCYHCHSEEQFYGGLCSRCRQGNSLDEITVYPGQNYECPEHGWAPCNCKNDLKCPFCGHISCICDACPCGDPWCPGGIYCRYQPPDPNLPPEGGPEGGEGGGGGNDSGNEGNEPTQNLPDPHQSFTYNDIESVLRVFTQLSILNKDLMGNRLMNALLNWNISITYNTSLAPMAQYYTSDHRIEWHCYGNIPRLVILEELVHALQHKNGCLRSDNKINMEVEAKIAQYRYAVKNNLESELYGDITKWPENILPYINTPSLENYQKIVNFVRGMSSTYQDPEAFADHPDYRNTNNIDILFIGY